MATAKVRRANARNFKVSTAENVLFDAPNGNRGSAITKDDVRDITFSVVKKHTSLILFVTTNLTELYSEKIRRTYWPQIKAVLDSRGFPPLNDPRNEVNENTVAAQKTVVDITDLIWAHKQ